MSWRAGSSLFLEMWPLIQKHVPDRRVRIEFTAGLLKPFVHGDMDPYDIEHTHPDVRAAMRHAGIEICDPRYEDEDKT